MTDQAAAVVLSERHGEVLLLTLNRPERLNAWTDQMEREYGDALAAADDDPEVRAIVVTGAGRGFCAGADMDRLQATSARGAAVPDEFVRPRTFPLTIRKPLIAAINGPAAGLGLIEALYCDLRFCVPDAKLTTAFSRRGLVAEYGVSWLLPRLIGTSAALDLLLSARVITGTEAHGMGLVDRLLPPEDLVSEALAYAQDLATSCSPSSMAIMKAQVLDDLSATFEDSVRRAEELMAASFAHPDMAEGVDSYLEKREPRFAPLPPRT
jgi:enoyl-CoA hydratase/carnithine racemase